MSSFYRPSTRTAARAAMAKLTRAERAAREESDLHILRASIERALLNLDPDSELAKHLRQTMREIRRHSLNALLPRQPQKPAQRASVRPEPTPRPEPPVHVEPQIAQDVAKDDTIEAEAEAEAAPPHQDQPPLETVLTFRSEKPLPSIEKHSDQASVKTGTAPMSIFTNARDTEQSATTKATSQMSDAPEEQQTPAKDSKKRVAVDDNDEPSPVTKRVKTWLSQLTGGYIE
ncbi:hypothetical protein BKA59DRAFT_126972 [Fusarium tricinctum]|uniref:Uncharacterized protein n=1 Tax=Fusarium tricinctum TaxID=61284 RepID=A0A8K0RZM9_9HYPO|nr:hypothetical protein BKA59DRAFT_126972 [Fusarium tricinctum]